MKPDPNEDSTVGKTSSGRHGIFGRVRGTLCKKSRLVSSGRPDCESLNSLNGRKSIIKIVSLNRIHSLTTKKVIDFPKYT